MSFNLKRVQQLWCEKEVEIKFGALGTRNHHQFLNPLTCFNPFLWSLKRRFRPPLWSQARIIKDGDTKTKFADVAGCDGAKTELMEAPKTKKKRWVWGNKNPGQISIATKPPEYIVIPYLDGGEFRGFFWNPPKENPGNSGLGIGVKGSQENLSQHGHDLQW